MMMRLCYLKFLALFGSVLPLAFGGTLRADANDQDDRKKTKVFGLGLSKTATTSMAESMKLLGYKTIHTDQALAPFMHNPPEAPLNLKGFYDQVDSVWDIPTAIYYQELLEAYPDALFVLTTRDSQKWYASFEKYLGFLERQWGCVQPERVHRLHKRVYGSRDIEPSWINAMEQHNQAVVTFFEDHDLMDQLLVLDIENDEIWPSLCTFLDTFDGPCAGRKMNQFESFPRANSISDHKIPENCPLASRPVDSVLPLFAYVMILCDVVDYGNDQFLRMVLVLFENIRSYDTENDIIVMFYGEKPREMDQVLKKMGIKTIRIGRVGGRVTIPDPFGEVQPNEDACYMAKIRALQLTEYERIMYVDSDILFQSDPRELFVTAPDTSLVAFDGSKSPLNGGLYVLTPSNQAFADLRDLANSGGFNPNTGWMDYGHFEDWRIPGAERNWTFWCAHSDQGIVYYYYDKLLESAYIRNTAEFDWLFVHFAGKNKPYLQDKDDPKSIKKRFREGTLEWFRLWHKVEAKLHDIGHTGTMLESMNSEETVEKTRELMEKRFLAFDPYDVECQISCGEGSFYVHTTGKKCVQKCFEADKANKLANTRGFECGPCPL